MTDFSSSANAGTYGPGGTISIEAVYSENLANGSSITVRLNNNKDIVLDTVNGNKLTGVYVVGATGSGEDVTGLTVDSIVSHNAVDGVGNANSDVALPPTISFTGLAVDTTAPVILTVDSLSPVPETNIDLNTSISTSFTTSEPLDLANSYLSIGGTNMSFTDNGGQSYGLSATLGDFLSSMDDFVTLVVKARAADMYGNVLEQDIATYNGVPSDFSTSDVVFANGTNLATIESELSSNVANKKYVISKSELQTLTNYLSDLPLFSNLQATDEVLVIKGDTINPGASVKNNILLVPQDTSQNDKLAVFIPKGTTFTNDPVNMGNGLGYTSNPSITNFTPYKSVDIPTDVSVNTTSGTIGICVEGSPSSFGVNSASSVSVYYSNDGSSWVPDSSVTNKTFTNDGKFCFDVNHLTQFSLGRYTPPASSSGGGGSRISKISKKNNNIEKEGLVTENVSDEETKIGNSDKIQKLIPFILLINVLKNREQELRMQIDAQPVVSDVSVAGEADVVEIKRGDVGDKVGEIQKALKGAGYSVLVTNIFSEKTENAVKQFQADKGLSVTGTVNKETYEALGVAPLYSEGYSADKTKNVDENRSNLEKKINKISQLRQLLIMLIMETILGK